MKKKKKWIRISRFRKGKEWRFRVIVLNKPIIGFNSHKLPRAERRGDKRPIKHVHVYGSKRHIPLDRRYIRYVVSDAWKGIRKRLRKAKRRVREKN